MFNDITITPFHPIGKDERGITKSFELPRDQASFIYVFRKAKSISGNTYHEGKNLGTNPKVFILIQGEIKISYRHKDKKEAQHLLLSEPCVISIQPLITHKIEAITDMIILECNSIADIQNDRFKLEV